MPVLRATFREAASRRLLLAVVVLTVVFVALFATGALLLRGALDRGGADVVESAIASTLLTVLGLYVASFLASFLALFLSAGAVSAELDSGQLHAVLARPISRGRWLLERWLGLAIVAVAYTLALAALLLLASRLIVG